MPQNPTSSDVIVIGGGISGLMSALALAQSGKKVLLLEKSPRVGGNCRTYEKDGYLLDTGVHAITDIKSGATRTILDRYFTTQPTFVPIGRYLARHQNRLQDIPLTLPTLASFSILSRRDRALMIGAMALMINGSRAHKQKQLDQSVASFITPYRFSSRALRFIDTLSYFLSGKPMEETPLWRMLGGSGFLQENAGFKQSRPTREKIKKLFNNNHTNQGYPLGGIQTITDCALKSMPAGQVKIATDNEVIRIVPQTDKSFQIITSAHHIHHTQMVVYSGYVQNLPRLIENLPPTCQAQLQKLRQTVSLTWWLGLKSPHPAFAYTGSEVFFDTDTPYWASPVSNFDTNLAPAGKQLIGFSTVVKNPAFDWTEEAKQAEVQKLRATIQTAVPNLLEQTEMQEVQFCIPEKAAVTVGATFPSPQSPLDGLYLVGTDTDMRSMGITRAAYSVLEMLKFAQADGHIKK